MIQETRTYFKSVVKTVDPDLKFDGLLNSSEKVGATALDRSYKLYFGELKPETVDSGIESKLDITMVIFKKMGSNSVDDFDKAYCKAIEIHALAQNRKNYNQENTIKRVECDAVIPEQIGDDGLAYRFILEFTVTLGYVYN